MTYVRTLHCVLALLVLSVPTAALGSERDSHLTTHTAQSTVLIVDGSRPELMRLAADAQYDVVVVGADEAPVAAISRALDARRALGQVVTSLHVLAHGRPGSVRLGSGALDRPTLTAEAAAVAGWRVAQIALWSCHVGQDVEMTRLLETVSGARVWASASWLGSHQGQLRLSIGALGGGASLDLEDVVGVERARRIDFSLADVSLIFPNGYVGVQGNATHQSNNIKTFATLGIKYIAFVQTDTNLDGLFGNGGTQGNDLAGKVRIYLQNGTILTFDGALNWRESAGGKAVVFGFVLADAASGVIPYGVGQTYTLVGGAVSGSSSTIGLEAIGANVTFVDGESRAGNAATSGLLSSLNTYLIAEPKPAIITLTAQDVLEGSPLVYTVTLTAPTTNLVSFLFSLAGTATSGVDYSAIFGLTNGVVNPGDGTLTIPIGTTSFTFTINTTADNVPEANETAILTIGPKSATGNIVECLSNSHCGGLTPFCDTAAKRCVACLTTSQRGGVYRRRLRDGHVHARVEGRRVCLQQRRMRRPGAGAVVRRVHLQRSVQWQHASM